VSPLSGANILADKVQGIATKIFFTFFRFLFSKLDRMRYTAKEGVCVSRKPLLTRLTQKRIAGGNLDVEHLARNSADVPRRRFCLLRDPRLPLSVRKRLHQPGTAVRHVHRRTRCDI
jgi:hypothetical protein